MKRLTQTADELGLRFATAKTSITPVNQGASFLGYQLALHAGHLAVAAGPRALPALEARLGDLASSVRGNDAGKLINRVNRTLRGWGEYYRFDRDVLAQGYGVAHGVVLAWLEKRFPRRIVRRYYVTSGSLGDGTAILLDPSGIYTDFPAAGLSNGRSAQPLSPHATGGSLTQGSSNPSAGAQEPRHRVVLRERCAETGVALSGDGATPIGDGMPAKRKPQLAGDEVPVQLPQDLLSMPPEAYADEFNRAVAFRARIAEELVGVHRGIAEIEHQKAVHAAQLRREAQMARLQLTKQQLKDELLLDPAFDALCRDELKLADQRRQLTAAHEAIDIHLKGWSRVVELRRQELVLNPPAVTRRPLRNR